MARLQDAHGNLIPVRTHHLLGRSRAMDTPVQSKQVSSQHLALTWEAPGWVVRDLASRNGTTVDGRRIAPGERAPVTRGAVIELGGDDARFTLVDDSPPVATARCGDRLVEAQGDFLALPDDDHPAAVVLFDAEIGWVLSVDDTTRSVHDRLEVVVADERWELDLPGYVDLTAEPPALSVPASALEFRVSSDEEYVEMEATFGGRKHTLPGRAHHYTLLTLARARLRDAAQPPAEQGWVYSNDLERMLRMSPNQIYVLLHRARRELEAVAFPAADRLVERRGSTRQVRIGIAALKVSPL